jgi:RNA polymerase sigma-70 factor, ECF subfamily
MDRRRAHRARRLSAARKGSKEALGVLLEPCRAYLLKVAAELLGPKFLSKADATDLVQETFLETHRDFVHFHGTDESELRAWLRARQGGRPRRAELGNQCRAHSQ